MSHSYRHNATTNCIYRVSLLLAFVGIACAIPFVVVPPPSALAEDPSFASRRTFGTGAETSSSVAVGDIDGDGNLDIVVGNLGKQSVVYLNDGQGFFYNGATDCSLTQTLRCFGGPQDTTTSLALSDMDGDRYLDIVVVRDGGQNVVYLNDQRGHFATGAASCGVADRVRCFGTGTDQSQALALGDVDGDGRVDIAVANRFQQSAVYLNSEATVFQTGAIDCASALVRCFGASTSNLTSITLVSIPDLALYGFGGLNIVVGRYDDQNAVYVNRNGQFAYTNLTCKLEFGVICFGPTTNNKTTGIAVGDVDGNGRPEVIATNDDPERPTTLYVVTSVSLSTITLSDFELPPRTYSGALLQSGRSPVLADVTNDGYLDLVAAYVGANQVYLSDLGYVTLAQVLNNPARTAYAAPNFDEDAQSIALGDVNHDGTIDLVLGKRGQNAIYLNNGPSKRALRSPLTHAFGASTDPTRSMTVGDLNGDRRLDLAVGKLGAQSAVYLNGGNGTFANGTLDCNRSDSVRCFGGPNDRTSSLAVGDIDADNDLDLIVGSDAAQSAVYLNDGTGGFAQAALNCSQNALFRCFGGPTDSLSSLAVGDVDGDQDLDIVAVSRSQPGALYLNDGTGNFTAIRQLSTSGAASVALGDLDRDSDADIIAGNTILLNDGAGNFLTTRHFSAAPTDMIAVGDLNDDGSQDIVAANIVFLNNGSADFFSGTVVCGVTATVRCLDIQASSVALGDANGDGSLDIAVGSRTQSILFFNDGAANFFSGAVVCGFIARTQCFGANRDATTSVVFGDVDNDGDADLGAGNDGHQSNIYLSGLSGGIGTPANQPQVVMSRPGTTQDGPFFSTPAIINDAVVPIRYLLRSANSTPVRFIRAFYSLDGGTRWQPAMPMTGTLTTDLSTSPAGMAYTYNWDVFTSGVLGQSDNVVFRIEAYPAAYTAPNAATNPSLRTYLASQTFPFRIRGTQVRVFKETIAPGNEARGAIVYHIPSGQTGVANPLADASNQPFQTNAQGYLQGREQVAVGDQLVAALPVSITDSYTLYQTSAQPTADGLAASTITRQGVQDIAVSAANPLLLFNLRIALEWDARYDEQFIARLQNDVRRTSELLYDWTNGQVALGQVSIFYDRQHWDDADVRIYASNRVRPTAAQGGIATTVITDPLSLGTTSPVTNAIVYEPGQIHIGAIWNRFGTASGNLDEDWPRTLAHEIGHYALYLNDNYIGLNSAGLLIPVPENHCPGAMSDPYSDDYSEFHPDADWASACADTLSQQTTGRSDWSTMTTFYPALRNPIGTFASLNPGPNRLPLNVTKVRFSEPTTANTARAVPIFYLKKAGSTYIPGPSARAFLFQNDHLIDLGRPVLDQVLARGARPNDRVCTYELAASLLGCVTVTSSNEQLVLEDVPDWQPEVTITPTSATSFAIHVANVPADLHLYARLFPMDTAAPVSVTLSYAAGSYSGVVTLAEPAPEGYLQIADATPGAHREIITDYALGGAPGFRRGSGGFRRGSGGFRRGSGAPVASTNGDVILFGNDLNFKSGEFFVFQAATFVPNPPSWATMVGQAYQVTTSPQAPDLVGTSMTFTYQRADLPPGEESGLRIYFWNGVVWTMLPTTPDPANTSASALMQGPGLYALMSSVVVPIRAAGWNLIAYPVQTARPPIEALHSIDGEYTTIYGYDAEHPDDPWKVYAVDAPAWVNTLTTLEYGQGYWMYATRATTLYLKGGFTQSSTSLQRSAASDSLPEPPATYYGPVRFGPEATPEVGMAVQAQVHGKVCGSTTTRMIDGQIVYVIHVSAADAGAHAGCGQLMDAVTFQVQERTSDTHAVWDNRQVHYVPLGGSVVYLPVVRHERSGG